MDEMTPLATHNDVYVQGISGFSALDCKMHLILNLDKYDVENIELIYHGNSLRVNMDKLLELGILYTETE